MRLDTFKLEELSMGRTSCQRHEVQEMRLQNTAAIGVFVEKQDDRACTRKVILHFMKIVDIDVTAR